MKLQRTKGNFPDQFSAKQFSDSRSELNMSSLELTELALYLCCQQRPQSCQIHESLGTAVGEKNDWGPWKAVLGSRAMQGGTREVKKMCSENGLTSPGLLQNDLPV